MNVQESGIYLLTYLLTYLIIYLTLAAASRYGFYGVQKISTDPDVERSKLSLLLYTQF